MTLLYNIGLSFGEKNKEEEIKKWNNRMPCK